MVYRVNDIYLRTEFSHFINFVNNRFHSIVWDQQTSFVKGQIGNTFAFAGALLPLIDSATAA